MNRILIIGCSGGGKSTLARALGVKLARIIRVRSDSEAAVLLTRI